LETIKKIVRWEDFRADIEAVTERKPEQRKSNALQSLHNLSDEQTEYLIRDRISFMRFLDLELEDPVPDATTIWLLSVSRGVGAGRADRQAYSSASASISRPRAILRAAARSLAPRLYRCPSRPLARGIRGDSVRRGRAQLARSR
jgi:Transposase domain (DUF772)